MRKELCDMGGKGETGDTAPSTVSGRGLGIQREKTDGNRHESEILRDLFVSTAIPLTLIEMSSIGASFLDGIFVSWFLGPTGLAVQGLAVPYYSVVGIISGLLSTGMQTLCASAYGKGETERAEGIFSMSIIVGVSIATALGLGFVFAGDAIGQALGATGNSADLLPGLKLYLIGLGVGTPCKVLFSLLVTMAQMNGGGRVVRVATAAGFVTDVVLDVAAGVFGWGMLGIGLATSAASAVEFAVVLQFILRPQTAVRFRWKGLSWVEFGSVVAIGLPKSFRRVANILRPLFLNRLVLFLAGDLAMSTMSMRNSLEGVGEVIGAGVSGALALMVGILVGEENRDGILQVCRLNVRYIVIGVGAVAIAIFVGTPWLVSFFAAGDPQLVAMGTSAFRYLALNLVPLGFVESYICFFQATKQIGKVYLVNGLSRFALVVACAFPLGFAFGIDGVWAAYPVSNVLLLAAMVVIASVRKGAPVQGLEDVLGLPDDIGVPPEDVLCYTVTSEDPEFAVEARDIYAFCESHGFDRGKGYRASRCLDEMVSNIIKHGFSSDDKHHSVDIRVVVKGDNLILRIRDDCVLFNVREKGEMWQGNNVAGERNVGIRMTMAIAKDVKYVNTLGTNTLLITV